MLKSLYTKTVYSLVKMDAKELEKMLYDILKNQIDKKNQDEFKEISGFAVHYKNIRIEECFPKIRVCLVKNGIYHELYNGNMNAKRHIVATPELHRELFTIVRKVYELIEKENEYRKKSLKKKNKELSKSCGF